MKRAPGVKFCSKDATCLLYRWLNNNLAAGAHLAEDLRYFSIQMCLLKLSSNLRCRLFSKGSSKQKGNTRNPLWNDVKYTAKSAKRGTVSAIFNRTTCLFRHRMEVEGTAPTHSRPKWWIGGGWPAPRPGRFTPGKDPAPLCRRLGGHRGRRGRVRKPGLDPQAVQPVASVIPAAPLLGLGG